MRFSLWLGRYGKWLATLATGLSLVFGAPLAMRYLDAAALLARIGNGGQSEGLSTWRALEIEELAFDLETAGTRVKARRYRPRGLERAPGVVLLHGIHRLGIDEPRLTAFARALATSGISVLTPELSELADYRIDAASIVTIGAAARALARDDSAVPGGITLMGFSFAGGLALLTAAEPAYAPYVKAVLAVGAHGDLERVARFFATNEATSPDGATLRLRAHDYGALVLVYGHAVEFFAEEDVPAAKEALRHWLHQDWDAAKRRASTLSLEGRSRLEDLFEGRLSPISNELIAWAERHTASMQAVSPKGKLNSLRAKVYLLHGAGDDVVPATESLWLARELPEISREEVLVSPAVQHVEPGKTAGFLERAKLVQFVARLLDTVRRS